MKLILYLVILVVSFSAAKAGAPFLCTPDISLASHSRVFEAISTSIVRVIDPFHYHTASAKLSSIHVEYVSSKALYETAAYKYDRPVSSEGYLDFMETIQKMSENASEYCNSPGAISDTVKEHLLMNFTASITGGYIGHAIETFGKLSCTSYSAFYDSLNATQLEQLIFAYDPESPPPTLAFVVDNTGSMGGEIEAVKDIILSFIKTERNEPIAYILGTFNDPLEG